MQLTPPYAIDVETFISITSTNRRPLLDIGLMYGVLLYTALGRLPPAAPSYSPDVICPPRWGPTYAAFIGAGSPFQHLKTPTSIGSPSYVPRPLPLKLRDSLSYVGNSISSTDLGAYLMQLYNAPHNSLK
ncbi:jg13339 [Pararge aegeria aegeria]|uniref:Jg13339 protein n=1 Tax=Pararge aegeria aegeria TaxID=348720 RepID=A0A8S4SGN3_9NEOP|nr:jg13339 [Pararge aegeria aegeria]